MGSIMLVFYSWPERLPTPIFWIGVILVICWATWRDHVANTRPPRLSRDDIEARTLRIRWLRILVHDIQLYGEGKFDNYRLLEGMITEVLRPGEEQREMLADLKAAHERRQLHTSMPLAF